MPKRKPTKVAPGCVATQAELARALGISTSAIQYGLTAGAPAKAAGGWNVEAWKEWRAANVSPERGGGARRGGGDEGDGARLLKAQADERRAKADLADLRLAIERKDFIARADVESWDRSRIAIVRRGLLGLGRQIAPLVVGLAAREIEAVVLRECKSLLMRFAAIK